MAQNHQNEGSGVAKCSKRHQSHKHRSKSFARVAIRGTGDFGTPHLASFFSLFFLMLDWNLSNKDATKTQGFTAVHCIIMRLILMLWLIGRWLSPLYHWLMCRLLSVRCRLSLPVCLSSTRPPVCLCLTLWHILTKWPSVLSYCRICWRKNNIVTPQYHSDKDES